MPAPSANPSRAASLKSFASTDRFLAEISSSSTLRPGYVLIGDEAFLYQRCRQGVLAALAPEATATSRCTTSTSPTPPSSRYSTARRRRR